VMECLTPVEKALQEQHRRRGGIARSPPNSDREKRSQSLPRINLGKQPTLLEFIQVGSTKKRPMDHSPPHPEPKRLAEEVGSDPQAPSLLELCTSDVNVVLGHLESLQIAPPDNVMIAIRGLSQKIMELKKCSWKEGGVASIASQMSTQKKRKEAEEIALIRLELEAGRDLEGLITRVWPRGAFGCTQVETKAIENCTGDKAVIINMESDDGKGAVRALGAQYLALERTLGRGFAPGAAITFTRVDSVRVEDDQVENYPSQEKLVVGLLKSDASVEATVDLLRKVGNQLPGCFTISAYGVPNLRTMRKLVEAAFVTQSREKIKVCGLVSGAAALSNEAEKRMKIQNKGCITVKGDGKTYAELLKGIKDAVTSAIPEANIRAIQETKSGAKIQLSGGDKETGDVCNALKAALPSAELAIAQRTRVVRIRNIDALTTREEVSEAVNKLPGLGIGTARVGALRKQRGNTLSTIISLPIQVANALLKEGKIKIGVVVCSAAAHSSEDDRCFKCWRTGHLARSCDGPDRSGHCFNCGDAGHRAASCSSTARCLDCGDSHRTGRNCREQRRQNR